MIMYGTTDCPDTINARKELEELGIDYEFKDLGKTLNLKEFLRLRDSLDIFAKAKEKGFIGVPTFVFGEDNETITLKLEDVKAQHGF